MDNDATKVRKLLRQQAAIAHFGSFALQEDNLLTVLTEAARVCAKGLDVLFSKVCRYRPVENDLLIEAGYGWRTGVVGHVVSNADETSPQGRAFITGQPSICNDLSKDNNYKLPGFYAEHNIISTIDVVIKGNGHPYGVLEIDNDKQHDYDQHDIEFLTSFANVLAEAVATSARREALQAIIKEKDALLTQKNILAEELQHRVRNNLHLVYGMLSKQLSDTLDEAGRRGIKAIARRVSTLAEVYDHLLGEGAMRMADFGSYIKSLCRSLTELHAAPHGAVTVNCDSDSVFLDLDAVTVLGIIVAELVSNSYDHAFPKDDGVINVSVRRPGAAGDAAILTVSDNGVGFTPDPNDKRHGLGLVRRLVKQVRGTSTVQSERGTVWTIHFPVIEAIVLNPLGPNSSTSI